MQNETSKYGLKVANPEADQFETVFQNDNNFNERKEIEKQANAKSRERQGKVMSIIGRLSNENETDSLGIWSQARTLNEFGVKAQQALDPFLNLKKDDHVTFFDIEAIGTPEHSRTSSSEKFFSITELSFKGTRFTGKEFVQDAGSTISIAVKPTKEVVDRLSSAIDQLANNKGMALSKDMERSLLDLTKYSDKKNFVMNRDHHGKKYTEIIGHAKIFPSNAAITSHTIAQMREGLNNLMSVETTVDEAMNIFKSEIESKNSKIAGYSIHNYDVPALISSTSDQTLRGFFRNIGTTSLDFYHAFSATTETPYSLIGGSARQEAIHRRLLESKVIRSTKGEGSQYLYHLAKDDILANIEIGGFMNEQIQDYLSKKVNSSEYLFSPTSIDRTPLKVGDNLFSFQGRFFDQDRDKYNLVGRQVDKDKVEPRWRDLDTSVPSMESFRIDNFFEDVVLSDTKKGYGVRLSSTEDKSDKVLYLFSETKEDLAQQIHSRFKKVNDSNRLIFEDMKKYKRAQESPGNRYKKMFEEGGFNRLSLIMDAVDTFTKDGEITDDLKEKVLNHKHGSPELLEDIPALSARLTEEKELWQEALNRIGSSNLKDHQKDVALRHFKQRVDKVGDNKGSVTVLGGKFKNFKFNENDITVLNARSTDSIKNSFRSYIRTGRAQERAGDAEVSYKISRINELQEIIENNFNIVGPESTKVKELTDNLRKEVRVGGKIETALTELASYVRNKVELDGSDTFERELMNGITNTRKNAIEQVLSNISNEVQKSIDHARSIHGTKGFSANPKLLGFLAEQDQRIMSLFERNFGAAGMNASIHIDTAKGMAAKYEELVKGIITSYSESFDTSLQIENGNKLYLTLHEKGKGLQNFDARTKEELRIKTNAAIIELPSFDEHLTVSYRNQRKAAIMKSGYNKNGVLYHSTTVTDALSMLLNYSEKAKKLAEEGSLNFNDIQSEMQKRISNKVDPITTQYGSKNNSDVSRIYSPKSEVAMRTASSKWDLSGFAEEWYRSKWLGKGKTGRSVQAVKEYMEEKKNITFFEALGAVNKSAANHFLVESIDFAREKTHLQGTMAGVSNVDYSRAIVATAAADPRRYNAFGNYYADAGENPLKTKNYRPLEERRAKKVFGDKTYRYQNSLISSDMADLREEFSFIRGIQTQSGYMTDHEIANRLKNAELVKEFKERIDNTEGLSKKQKRAMKSALDSYMLSSTEGLGFMDHTLFEAYDHNTEKRISFRGDSVEFASKIEKKIEEALIAEGRKDLVENQAWKQTTFSFDRPIEININDLIDDKGKTTIGMYTRGTIIESLEEEKAFRRGDKVTINGFSGEGLEKTLTLGRENKMGHGLKIVTEGGYRGTMVPMLKSIIEDIYGQKGVDQVITHLDDKKGANDLAAIIRGYETNIRQQINGEITVSDWVKQRIQENKSENDILEDYYKEVRSTFGLDEKQLYMKDGISVVSSDLGYDGNKTFEWKQRTAFIEKMNSQLDMKRVVYGDVNFAHDITYYQGGKNRGKYTIKEIEMLDKAYERAFIEPGKRSEHTEYLRSLISGDLATPETRVKQKAYKEMLKAAENYNNGWTPSKNDIVIDYTTDGPAVQGKINAVKKDGVIHVSKDHFKVVPEPQQGSVFTVQDYMNTIIKAGDESIQLQDGYETVIAKHLADHKATAYLKLPEEVGARNQYVPLIDVSSMSLPIRPEEKQMFLNATQSHYARIDRKVNEYNTIHINENMTEQKANAKKAEVLEAIQLETEALKDTFAKYTSGNGMADITSRRMPMSSQFQFAGVNSVAAYSYKDGKWSVKKGLDEGTLYMNRKNVSDLVGNKAKNIVKSWGVDLDDVRAEIKEKKEDGHKRYNMKQWVLDNWNNYDTYSTAVRYPSIDSATNQALKLKIHDGVGINQVMGLRGLAERISGDWDGDTLAVFLTHYGIDNDKLRKRVVDDISRLQEYDAKRNKFFADLNLDHMKSGMEDDLIQHVLGESKSIHDLSEADQEKLRTRAKKVTDLHFSAKGKIETIGDKAMEDAFNAVIQSNGKYTDWGSNKVGEGLVAKQEYVNTLAARATFQSVGSADKVRMRMSAAFESISRQRYEHFHDAEGIYQYSKERFRRETAIVDEFLREFSQKAISSKKIDLGDVKGSTNEVKAVTESLDELYSMINQLSNPNSELSIGDITTALIEDKGLYKDGKIPLENKFGVLYKKAGGENDVYQFVTDAIKLLQEGEQFHVEATGKRIKDMSATMLAASQGIWSFKELSRTVQTGEHLPGQLASEEQKRYLSEAAFKRYEEYEDVVGEGVRRTHLRLAENQHNNRADRLADSSSVSDIMNNGTRASAGVVPNGDVAVYRTIRSEINDTASIVANKTKRIMSNGAAGMLAMGAASFAGLWAGNTLMGKTPTPEGVAQAAAPVNPEVMQSPTARITPNQNGEYINIQVKASNAKNLNPNDIAAMLNTEIMAQSGVSMNHNVMVSDNSRNIDQQWLQGAVYNAINKGYAY